MKQKSTENLFHLKSKFPKNKILEPLESDGYILITKADMGSFSKDLSELGGIIRATDVKIKDNEKMAVYSSPAIPFHTDSPEAAIIYWECIDSGTQNTTEMIFIDALEEINKLPIDLADELKTARVKYRSTESNSPTTHPLVSSEGVYFNPWFVDENTICPNLLQRLKIQFSKLNTNKIQIKLSVGDTVVVDNRRLLHGRNAIEEASTRHLRRHWLKQTARNY